MNVHLDLPSIAVPGETCTATVTVENSSAVVRAFKLSVAGVDGWAQVVPATLSLFPGETGQARVVFRPPASPEVIAGAHPFAVRCAATDSSDVRVEEGVVTVARHTAIDLNLRPNCARARRRANFRLHVTNVGNQPGRFQLSADDENEMLSFDLATPSVSLAAGETAIVRLKAAHAAARPGENLPFRVTVKPAELSPLTTTGSVSVRAGFLLKLLPILAAVVALALVALALWPKDPVSQAADAPLRSTLPSSTELASTTSADVTTTTTASTGTTPAPTTTTLPPTEGAATTTTVTAPVAGPTSTVAQQQAEVPVQPQPETPSAPTAAPTTTAPTVITMVVSTIFFPPVFALPTTTTTAPPPQVHYTSMDVEVYFHVDPHWLFDFTPNCQFIHSPSEVDAFTSTVWLGWTIDTTKGDPGHLGIAEIADNSNSQARNTLQQYDFQPTSSTTWSVTGIVCGASNDGPGAIFSHTYRVYLTTTL